MSSSSQHTPPESQSGQGNDRRWSAFESINTSNPSNNISDNLPLTENTIQPASSNPFRTSVNSDIDKKPVYNLMHSEGQQKSNSSRLLYTHFPVPFSDLNNPSFSESANNMQNTFKSNTDMAPPLPPKLQINTDPVPSVPPLFLARKSSALPTNDTKADNVQLPKQPPLESQPASSSQNTVVSNTTTVEHPFHIPRKPISHQTKTSNHVKRHSIAGSIVQSNFGQAPTPSQPLFYAPQNHTGQDDTNSIHQEQQHSIPPRSSPQPLGSAPPPPLPSFSGTLSSSGFETQSRPEQNYTSNDNYLKIVYGQEQQLPQHPPDPGNLRSKTSIARRYSRSNDYTRHDISPESLPDFQAAE